MSSTFSQASAVSPSDSKEPECEPSRSVKSSPSVVPSSRSTGRTSPAMTTSAPLQPTGSEQTELPLMLSAGASPARTSPLLERALALKEAARAYGQSTPALLANYAPDTSSWRTSQRCLVEGWTVFSETWPRSGMMQSGIAYQLPPLAPLTDETGFGLWPTPVVPNGGRSIAHVDQFNGRTAYHKGKKVQVDLRQAVKLWPTPTAVTNTGGAALCKWGGAGSREKLRQMVTPAELNGALNPTWVEWLMGFPLGWTDCADWATPSSRKSRKSSGGQS
jgi:hypothetical protein